VLVVASFKGAGDAWATFSFFSALTGFSGSGFGGGCTATKLCGAAFKVGGVGGSTTGAGSCFGGFAAFGGFEGAASLFFSVASGVDSLKGGGVGSETRTGGTTTGAGSECPAAGVSSSGVTDCDGGVVGCFDTIVPFPSFKRRTSGGPFAGAGASIGGGVGSW
jgi:hypothetical protein